MDSMNSPSAPLGDNECEAPTGFPDTSQWNMIKQLPEPVKFPAPKFPNPTQMNVATNNDRYDYDVQLTREFLQRRVVYLSLTVMVASSCHGMEHHC